MERKIQAALDCDGYLQRLSFIGTILYVPSMKQPYFTVCWDRKYHSLIPLENLVHCDLALKNLIYTIHTYFDDEPDRDDITVLIEETRKKYGMKHDDGIVATRYRKVEATQHYLRAQEIEEEEKIAKEKRLRKNQEIIEKLSKKF